MKFSIVTPSFNGMPALRRCIGSIRGQAPDEPFNGEPPNGSFPLPADLPKAENGNPVLTSNDLNEAGGRLNATVPVVVHHHVQDGGSSDGTIEFLHKFDAEVRHQQSEVSSDLRPPTSDLCPAYTFGYSSERDAGMYDAINKGWAKGFEILDSRQWNVASDNEHFTNHNPQQPISPSTHQPDAEDCILSWLNADEQYLPGTLAKVALCFEKHPDVDVVFGNMIIVEPNGRPLAARREIPFRPFYVKRDFLYTASCTLFFRRTLFEQGLLNFNTSYRLAGDMDLILKLAANGVKFWHINDYLSLFGTDNNNLSVKHKARMEEEVQQIRRFYGGSNSPWICKAAKMMRFAERAFCGCYWRDSVSFWYANNERPEYRRIVEDRLGFRFTYERAQKKRAKNDQ